MKKLRNLLLGLLLISFNGLGQIKDFRRQTSDSSAVRLRSTLLQNEQQRVRDSIKLAILTEELSNYRNANAPRQKQIKAEMSAVLNQDSLRQLQQKQAIDALKSSSAGSKVMLYYDTLFTIYAPLGSFSAEQRALHAQEKIRTLYDDPNFIADSLTLKPQFGLVNLTYGADIITSTGNIDGLWAGISADTLAETNRQKILKSISYFKTEYSWNRIAVRLGYLAGAVIALGIVSYLIMLFFGKIQKWLVAKSRAFSNEIKFRNYQLFTPRRLIEFVGSILMVLRILLIALTAYLTLIFMFSIFPATKSWTYVLLGWVWEPLKLMGIKLINYIPDLFTAIVIVLISNFFLRVFRFFSIEIQRNVLHIPGFHPEWARPTFNIIRILIYAFTFIVIFPYLPGSDSEAFKGVSVFLGILISIGSSSAVSNTIAGLIITYMRPFKEGDWIKVNDITGCVIDKTMLVTRLRTIYNEDVTVPNSAILASHTINYSSSSSEPGLLIHTSVTFAYDVDQNKVEALLIQSAGQTEGIDTVQSPYVLRKQLNDFYIVYELNACTHSPERMFFIQSELHQHIIDNFREAGIDMNLPSQIKIRQ